VQLLLEHGVDSNLRNTGGRTPLSAACEQGRKAVVELLLQHGADFRVTVEAGPFRGLTVLMIAVHNGHADIAKLLLARGADVHAVDQRGRSALIYAAAAQSNRAALVKLLLQHGANLEHRAEMGGETALLSAVVSGDAECTQLLVDAGADVNMRCGAMLPGTTKLAGTFGIDSMTVTTVHGFGVTVHAAGSKPVPAELHDAVVDDMSTTVLMAADTPAVVKILLAAGADVHRTTDQGSTCLHTAAACNYPAPVICLLIKAGVDLQALNSKGQTAAAVAHDKGNTLAAALLNRAAKDA
jgi:ankyrin repeat protein